MNVKDFLFRDFLETPLYITKKDFMKKYLRIVNIHYKKDFMEKWVRIDNLKLLKLHYKKVNFKK
jgi:hypothetical protein